MVQFILAILHLKSNKNISIHNKLYTIIFYITKTKDMRSHQLPADVPRRQLLKSTECPDTSLVPHSLVFQ